MQSRPRPKLQRLHLRHLGGGSAGAKTAAVFHGDKSGSKDHAVAGSDRR